MSIIKHTGNRGLINRVKSSLLQTTTLFGTLTMVSLGSVSAVQADDITLKALDGSSEITAKLLEFDGNRYRLETTIGEILIDAFQVECISGACPTIANDDTRLAMSGNSDLLSNLMPALLEDYTTGVNGRADFSTDTTGAQVVSLTGSNNEQLGTIELSGGSSSQGIQALIGKQAMFAVSDRPVTEEEADIMKLAGLGDPLDGQQQIVLALDGLVVVTAQGNPVNAVSEADIADIFAGRMTNWSELGGPDAPINLYSRSAQSGTGASFNEMLLQPNNRELSENTTLLESDVEVSKAVLADPNGIGFVNYSGLSGAKPLSILGNCGLQTPANPFTLKTEEYPLTRRVLMYRPAGEAPALADNFVDYLQTQDAQDVIAANNYVDKAVSLKDSKDQGLRYASAMWPTDAEASKTELGNMVRELLPAKRVSLTFRFELGSTQLDGRALEDLERLSDLLAEGKVFANKEMLLVGFTDSIGKSANNRFLSQQRAETVRQLLQETAIPGSLDTTPIRSLGFGEASPLTCNDTAVGQGINRRVEVWVRDIING